MFLKRLKRTNYMKDIKIKFYGFDNTLNTNNNIILDILRKHYNVIITDDADFVFCSIFKTPLHFSSGFLNGFCENKQVRIMIQGENYVPDFNLADYAISSYPITFFDRHYSIPFGVEAFTYGNYEHFLSLPSRKREFSKDDLLKKEHFANFLANHDSENNIRGDFFKKLSEYKRIESPGRLYHNNDTVISWRDSSKTDFQGKSKFTLCFESTKNEGFTTEKIIDAFYAGTIPVYYGSSTVSQMINPKAFINVEDFDSFDDAIEKIIEIDNNDELYMQMMREPIFVDENFQDKVMKGFEDFLVNIFDQEPEKAYRRSRVYTPKLHEDFLLKYEEKAFKDKFRWPMFKRSILKFIKR